MEYVIRRLNDYNLAHLLLMGTNTEVTGSVLEHLADDGMYRHFRPLYRGHIIANVDMTLERANRLIKEGVVDSVAFGRSYIANPDLVERLCTGAPLAEIDWPTVYASGQHGYTDYPTCSESLASNVIQDEASREQFKKDLFRQCAARCTPASGGEQAADQA